MMTDSSDSWRRIPLLLGPIGALSAASSAPDAPPPMHQALHEILLANARGEENEELVRVWSASMRCCGGGDDSNSVCFDATSTRPPSLHLPAPHALSTRPPRALHAPSTRPPRALHAPSTRPPRALQAPSPPPPHPPSTRPPRALPPPSTRPPRALHVPSTRPPRALHAPSHLTTFSLHPPQMSTLPQVTSRRSARLASLAATPMPASAKVMSEADRADRDGRIQQVRMTTNLAPLSSGAP